MDFATFHWRLPQLKINKKRLPHFALLLTGFAFFLPFFVKRKLSIFAGEKSGNIIYGLDREHEYGLLVVYFLEPVPSAFCLCMYCETDFESTSALACSTASQSQSQSVFE